MCLDCTEGEHREHMTVPLRDVVEQHKAALKTQLDAIHSRWDTLAITSGPNTTSVISVPTEVEVVPFPTVSGFRLPQLTAAIELVSEISRQLNERKNEAVVEITSTFEELERVLHLRKTALVTDLENICGAKQKVCVFNGLVVSADTLADIDVGG